MKKIFFLVLIAICGSLVVSFTIPPDEEEPVIRPLDPFVFRLTLDERPRVIAIALHPDLWVGYDAENCSLFKMWTGSVKFDGGVYNGLAGPQPSVNGYPFIENLDRKTRWKALQKGNEVELKTNFKGYLIQKNRVTFLYELILPNEHVIRVEEYPEYFGKRKGEMTGLQRQIRTYNVPKDIELRIKLDLDGLLFASDLKSSGKLKQEKKIKRHYDWGSMYDWTGEVIVNSNEETELTTIFTLNPELVMKGN